MDVADVFVDCADGCGEIGFLDVHVEEVGEQDDVFEGVRFDEIRTVGEAVDEVGFVAVQWLVNEGNLVLRGGFSGDAEGVGEPFEGLVAGDIATPFSLHGAEDGGGTELAAEGDHLFEEIEGSNALFEGGIGERESVLHHTGSRADGGDAEAVGLGEGFDLINGKGVGAGEEKFDIIEAGFLGEGEALGEGFVKDEGTSGGFGNLAEGDGSAHETLNFKL